MSSGSESDENLAESDESPTTPDRAENENNASSGAHENGKRDDGDGDGDGDGDEAASNHAAGAGSDDDSAGGKKSPHENGRIDAAPAVGDDEAAAAIEEPIPIEPKIELLYTPPPWSTPPQTPYYFEVREGEDVVEKVPVNVKGHYLIGRLPICDIVVDDATCSRQHAIVQFRPGDPDPQTGKRQDEVYIYDLGSTSGTYVNGMPLQAKAYYPLYKGDILQFGQYSCAFVMRDGSEPGVIPPDGVGASNGKKESSEHDKPAFDFSQKNIDPRSANFDEDAYKQAMIEKYMQQQRENEEILRRRKERVEQGLPPEDADFVPEVKPLAFDNKGKGGKKGKKDKKGKDECVIS